MQEADLPRYIVLNDRNNHIMFGTWSAAALGGRSVRVHGVASERPRAGRAKPSSGEEGEGFCPKVRQRDPHEIRHAVDAELTYVTNTGDAIRYKTYVLETCI